MNIFSKPILGLFFFSYLWLFESRSFIIFSFIFSLFCILNMFVFLSVVMISFCFPLVLQFGTLFLGILSILYLFLIKCEVKVKVHYFLSIYPYVPGPFTENSIPSPIKLSQHCFFGNQLTIYTQTYFWTPHSVLLIYISILRPVAHYLYYHTFIIPLIGSKSYICLRSSSKLLWLFFCFLISI